MLSKNFILKSKKINGNIKKTKKIFNSLKSDLMNLNIPVLKTYEKNYQFNFSENLVKKFSKYNNIIIIGMGGSILGTKSIYSFFKTKIKKNVFFFDNLDQNLYLNFKNSKFSKNSCFIIVSKSGNTLETIVNLGIIFSKSLYKNKLIIITEVKDSALMNIANKFNAEIIEHHNLIGGRYSVLSEVGMFPAALMGLNIAKFQSLRELLNNKNFVSNLIRNVAIIYTLNNQGIRNSVLLNYDSSLNDLCFWYQQLVGESLGKKGKGITPIVSLCPKDHHSLFQLYLDGPKDKFFTFLDLKKIKSKSKISKHAIPENMKFLRGKTLEFITRAQSDAAQKVFDLKKIPYRKIVLIKNSEEELGKILTFFVLETILLARLIKVDPFNQPAGEHIKIQTRNLLK